MTKKCFFTGMSAAMLAFVLVLSVCENPATAVEGTVGISNQAAPNVTTKAVKGGVLLEWPPVLDAEYAVWRMESGSQVEAIRLPDSGISQNKTTGMYHYADLVSDDNELKKDTDYIYTVVTSGNSKTSALTQVSAKPDDIPAKGTQLDPVSDVTLDLDYEAEKIKVSWKEPEGGTPSRYEITVYRDDSDSPFTTQYADFGETSKTIDWYSQSDGEYTARVRSTPLSGNTYFKNSDFAASEGKKFEDLFGELSASINGGITLLPPADNTIKGFTVPIVFGDPGKPEVIYSVERATVSKAGNAGKYEKVPVYKDISDTENLTDADLTADILGNLPNYAVYDKGLPATGGKYKYQIKATKDGKTQTKEISSTVTADPRDYAVGSISVGTASGSDPLKYAVTPVLTYKGALQDGDKLVIYYTNGSSDNIYQSGPYKKGPEFSKSELEAGTASGSLSIPKAGDDSHAYVLAYFEFVNGKTSQDVYIYGGGVAFNGYGYGSLSY